MLLLEAQVPDVGTSAGQGSPPPAQDQSPACTVAELVCPASLGLGRKELFLLTKRIRPPAWEISGVGRMSRRGGHWSVLLLPRPRPKGAPRYQVPAAPVPSPRKAEEGCLSSADPGERSAAVLGPPPASPSCPGSKGEPHACRPVRACGFPQTPSDFPSRQPCSVDGIDRL